MIGPTTSSPCNSPETSHCGRAGSLGRVSKLESSTTHTVHGAGSASELGAVVGSGGGVVDVVSFSLRNGCKSSSDTGICEQLPTCGSENRSCAEYRRSRVGKSLERRTRR